MLENVVSYQRVEYSCSFTAIPTSYFICNGYFLSDMITACTTDFTSLPTPMRWADSLRFQVRHCLYDLFPHSVSYCLGHMTDTSPLELFPSLTLQHWRGHVGPNASKWVHNWVHRYCSCLNCTCMQYSGFIVCVYFCVSTAQMCLCIYLVFCIWMQKAHTFACSLEKIWGLIYLGLSFLISKIRKIRQYPPHSNQERQMVQDPWVKA